MNRSILFPTFALAFVAAPLTAPLAGEAPPSDTASAVAAQDDGASRNAARSNGARRLTPEECKELREQVRQAAEEHKDEPNAAGEKDGG